MPLNPQGTDFQLQVWQALCDIPYGETRSYQDIAIAIGNKKACRAVGQANNHNPIAIIIPCHRVIGANGALVGFAGRLDLKVKLLKLENPQINLHKGYCFYEFFIIIISIVSATCSQASQHFSNLVYVADQA